MNKKISGIYQILNKITGMRYIGQSVDVLKRKSGHFNDLRAGKHKTPYLQNSWNAHEEKDFEWSIVELVEPDKKLLAQREQFWCDQYPFDQLYNSRVCSDSNLGIKHSDEFRAKMSAARKGIKHSDEHCAKISAAQKGKKHSPESVARMSAAKKGKKNSPEHRANMGVAHQKPVLQIDKITGQIIKRWESGTIAARELGIDLANISACANGRLKSAGGFIWKYAEK